MHDLIKVSNRDMPSVGLGLWKIKKRQTSQVVQQAIKIGYRHLDSAADYGNEMEVGSGINESIRKGYCNREDLWVTSKLWNTYHSKENIQKACERSLMDLGLDYLDLYLIHFPISLRFVSFDYRYPPGWIYGNEVEGDSIMKLDPVPLSETWMGMERLVEKGLVKSIGVCNYNSALLHDLMSYANIKPEMLQIESHPYLTQDNLIQLAKDYNIPVTCFSPLGALSYVSLDMASASESILEKSKIKKISEDTGKTPAQVVLRWGLERGTAIIPKTVKLDRLKENIAIFDFELTNKQVDIISSLNCNRRFNDPGIFCKESFGKFHPIYD